MTFIKPQLYEGMAGDAYLVQIAEVLRSGRIPHLPPGWFHYCDDLVARGLLYIEDLDAGPYHGQHSPRLTKMGGEYITHLLNLGSL